MLVKYYSSQSTFSSVVAKEPERAILILDCKKDEALPHLPSATQTLEWRCLTDSLPLPPDA